MKVTQTLVHKSLENITHLSNIRCLQFSTIRLLNKSILNKNMQRTTETDLLDPPEPQHFPHSQTLWGQS